MDVGNNPEQANQTSSHQRPCDNGEHFSIFSSGAANSESGGNKIGGLQVDSASHADSLHALPATAVPSAGELVNSVQGGLPSSQVTPGPSNTPSVPGPSTSTNPVRRKLGRPKGSKNKLQNPSSLTVRRPVGRPRGSGPKQKARAASAASLPTGSPVNTVTAKRPVGRPRKAQATSGVTVEFGNFVCLFLLYLNHLLTFSLPSLFLAKASVADSNLLSRHPLSIFLQPRLLNPQQFLRKLVPQTPGHLPLARRAQMLPPLPHSTTAVQQAQKQGLRHHPWKKLLPGST
ncbi:hypothetical protein BDZ97DRAFT_822302 [Flammula alnicola]|nr:hypothetical protein BDZ97DRAFT_822302 [Flammula alnicola]